MKQRYGNLRKRFKQIINEKNKFKEKRSHSFIEPDSNYFKKELDDNENDSFTLTKNSFYKKEENNINIILNKKYNILKKSLDKLQLILEKNIKEDNIYKNNAIQNVYNIKNYYINELANDTFALSNELQIIKNVFEDGINKRKEYKNNIYNEVNNLVGDITKNTTNTNDEVNNPRNKIELYMNNQQNYFHKINQDMKRQIEDINLSCNDDMQYSNQKYNIIMNDINAFKDKIYKSDKKEKINREEFKEKISCILNDEIDKITNDEMINSIELNG